MAQICYNDIIFGLKPAVHLSFSFIRTLIEHLAKWHCRRVVREAVFILPDQFLRSFIPAAFEEIAGFLINSQIVGAGLSACTGTAAGAADGSVRTVTAFLVVADAFFHFQEADIAVIGIRQDLAERLFQYGFEKRVDRGSAERHAGQDPALRTDINGFADSPAGIGLPALSAAVKFPERDADPL